MQKNRLLIFPSSRSIREYIKKNSTNRLLPKLITIDEFFKKVLFIPNKRYANEEQKFLLLKEAIKIDNFSKLGISSNFTEFLKQSQYLFRFFGEISTELVSIDEIKKSDTYAFYGEHITLLDKVFNNYKKLLDENNLVDKVNLANSYEINSDFLESFNEIEIYFEGYFTNFEFKVLSEVSLKTELLINFQTNEYNKKSVLKFIEYGIENIEDDFLYKISLTQKKIIEKEPFIKINEDIKIEGFNSKINQIAFIKNSIAELCKKGIEPKDIVVIVPNESFVKEIELFDYEKYFNYAMGRDIRNSIFYRISNSINEYLNEKLEKKNIESLEFYGIKKDEIDEKYLRVWRENLNIELFLELIEFIKSFEENSEILEKVDEEIYSLKKLFIHQDISLKEAFKIYLQKIASITIDDTQGGAITVMGLLESRGISFDGLVIVDFNEDTIPRRSIKDKFLSSNVKKHSNLPTNKDRESLQKYYYKRLLDNAKHVYISFLNDDSHQISRFANELFDKKLIPSNNSDKRYENILYNNYKIEHLDKDIILDVNLANLTWSATSLKDFLTCKRRFYLKHIAKIREHHFSLKPKGFEVGTLIHSCMQKLFSKNSFYIDEKSLYKDIVNELNSIKQNNPYIIIDIQKWIKKLSKFARKEISRFESGVRVVDTEKYFLIDYNGIKLTGSIDRVDSVNNTLEIIDYKTSSSLKVDTPKTYENSKDFQLEFYYLAAKSLYGNENINTYYYDLNGANLLDEVMLDQKLLLLENILKELNTNSVEFNKCIEKSNCVYCPYKLICNR